MARFPPTESPTRKICKVSHDAALGSASDLHCRDVYGGLEVCVAVVLPLVVAVVDRALVNCKLCSN